MLAYEDFDPRRIERVAAMLLVDEIPGAESIDGSGGDEAQDVRWASPDGLVIFEIKSFARRLNPTQRRQIRNSLLRAVELHSPAKWVLVMPLDHSPAERRWFDEHLAALVPEVTLEWWGRAWFDGHLAKRGDLLNYIEGADATLLRRAKEMAQEQSVLAGGARDLADRMATLAARGDELSPYWRWDTITRGDAVTLVLTAKRPDSDIVDPIHLQPEFTFPVDDPEAQAAAAALRRALGFGGDVTIPAKYVVDLRVVANSEETRRLLGDDRRSGELRFVSATESLERPLSLELRLTAPDETVRRSITVACTTAVRGTRGSTYAGTDPSGVLHVRLVLTNDASAGHFEFEYEPVVGRLPHDVLPAIEFLAEARPEDTIVVATGPVRLGRTAPAADAITGLQPLARYLRALARLQEHGRCLLPVPADPGDERDVINAADLLDGQRVQLPYAGLNIGIRPGHVRDFLAQLPDDAGALYATQDLGIEVAGERIELGSIATYAPAMRLANRDDLEAVGDDPGEHTAEFRCIDDGHIYWMKPVEDVASERSA